MEKQYESPNIDNSSDSDEKSSSRFIPRRVLETSVEQASPSWIDHVRNNGDQVLVDDDTRINVTKCNYLFKTETMNLSGSSTTELSPTELDATEIARSNRSKSLELLQYLQECIQKIDSRLKNNEESKESLDVAMNTISNYISKLDALRIQKLAKKWLEIRNNLIYGRRNFRNSDSTTNSSKSGEESKDYQNKEKENREMSQKIDELPSFRSTDALVKNLEVGKSIDSMTNIHDISSTSITDDQPETTDNKEYLDPVNSAELISTPKYALELKSQFSQKCIQKIESDLKSKNYEGLYSMESSLAESFYMDQLNASNRICELYEHLSEIINMCHVCNQLLFLKYKACFYTNNVRILRKNNSNSTTETSVEQASPSRTDYVRNNGDQVLVDDDTRINVMKCNYLFKTETMNLSGSSTTELSPTELDATEIARSNRSKSALELLQYLQECIQKIDSKLKNNEESKESLDVAMNTISNYISKLDTLRIQKLAKKWLEIRNNLIYGRRNFRNSDSTTNSSKSGEDSKNYQNKEKENREMSQKIDELPSFRSTDALVKNLEVGRSIDSMTNIHDISSTSITDDQPETTDNKEYLDPVNSTELISTRKYALVLKSQSSQECIQKIESDNKSKNYEGSYSMESSPAELSCMDQLNASNYICEQVTKKIDICHGYNELLLLIFEADLYTNYKVQIPRENNSDSTTNSSKSDEESRDYQNKEKENYEMSQKIDELPSFRSTDASVKYLEVEKSIDSMTNIHDISSTSITDDQPETTDNKEYLDPVNSAELISTPKYALELKSQSSQKCIQKIESDLKSKNYEGLYSMESSLAELFYMDQLNASNRICELYEHLSEIINMCHVYNQLLFLKYEACFYTDNVRILRKNNSNSTTETSVEQASPSRTDYVRGQILADNNAGTNVTECNYSSETKTLNLPESSTTEPSTTESSPMESSGTESSATEIAQPSTSKSTLELKSQLSQESTQKNDSDNKPKENQDKCQIINTKAEESMDLTADIHDNTSDSPASEPTDDQAEAMNDEVFVKFLEKFTSTSMSKDKSLQWKCLNVISKFACRILIFLFLILPQLVMMVINKVASKYMITYDKAEKNKKSEYIQDTDIKIRRKKSFTCLKCFIILLILILSLFLFLFLFYFHFRPVYLDKDDMYFDTFATTVVELEKRILDHDATIRVLTEYLERDTPSLKVVALIGDTSVDKPYTVDIIKKRLRKRRSNSSSLSLPTFIVLENLRAEHSKVVINYVNMYQEAYGDREFTILAVFKVDQIDDDLTRVDINHVIDTVKDIFIEANIIMKIIPFKPLSEETLEKHIKNTAKNIGQTFSQDQIDYHKRRLIEDNTDCQRKYGC